MTRILVIAEHDGSSINPSTAKTLSCAHDMDAAEIHVALFAADPSSVAAEAAALDGVTKVLCVSDDVHAHPMAATVAPQLVELADGYDCVLGPSTTFGKDLMPRVAALLGVNQVSDIMSVDGPRSFKRPIYAGNAIVSVRVPEGSKVVATVRTASYRAVGTGGTATIEDVSPAVELPTHTRFVDVKTGASDRPDLQTAATVVSGGRALASAENFELIFKLADTIGAGVGASRAAVDAGYVPNEMQVGQTGKIIAPDLYIAIGISGAIQHLTGIKDAGTIVAINKDEEAPIFEVADIGLVGDLFAVVPELTQALA